MTTALQIESITKGIFLAEIKNRFLCEVNIDGIPTLCYVPSSCRLEKLITLVGKEVLLLPTVTQHRKTSYALFAVAHKRNYIILNSSIANTLLAQNLQNRRFSFLGNRKMIMRECVVEGYKCDFFITETKTIIEVKSIITADSIASFPSVYSLRAIKQLSAIKKHLLQGNPAYYIIVSLNPYLKNINLDRQSPFYKLFTECMALGLNVVGVACCVSRQNISIRNWIDITY